MTRIDAHQHFWDRSLSQFDHSWQEAETLKKICRSFLPQDLHPLIEASGIDHTIFVQTQHDVAENRWALELAKQNDFVCGVVGWVDLASENCEQQLLEFTDDPKFVGVRHVVQDEPDDDFMLRDDVARGLAVLQKHGVPFDLLFYSKHLKHAATIAGRFPELLLVIDHLSKPEIRRGDRKQWSKDLQSAAKFENVFCKLSGMVTEADWQDWTLDDFRPYAETAIECFGPQRLMFGSDWPVCELAATYQQVHSVASELISGLSQSEQDQIFGQTARQFYSIAME